MKISPKIEKSGRGKYCSMACYNKGRGAILIDKKCSSCLQIFKVPKWKEYVGKKAWFCNKDCWINYIKIHPEYHKQYNPHHLKSHPVLTKEILEKEYLVNGLKMREIAIKYGYGYVTVNDWINKYKIPTRKQADYLEKTTLGSISRELKKERNNTCELCGWNKASCDVHHIKKQCDGGTHEKSNLIVLCPNCHRMVTEGKVKI